MTATLKNDVSDYKKFMWHLALVEKKKMANLVFYGIMTGLCVLASIVFAIIGYAAAGLFLLVAAFFAVLIGVSLGSLAFSVNKNVKLLEKNAPDYSFITNKYDFSDDALTVTSVNAKKENPTVTSLSYDKILKGVEKKDRIYIFLYPTVAATVKKEGCDDYDGILELLKNKLGDKMICRKKNV